MPQRFGLKLRFLRKQRGLTQEQLAAQSGVITQGHITDLENNKTTISLLQMVRLADFFGVPTDYFLRDSIPVDDVVAKPRDYTPIDEDALKQRIGMHLRALRTRRKIPQTHLASAVALTNSGHISRIEAGHKLPSLELVVRLADFFGVPTDALLRGETPPATPAAE